MINIFKKAIILPLIIAVAIGLVVYKVKTKPAIEHTKLQYPTRAVNVVTAKQLLFSTHAIAYGHVAPETTLKAKAEINGKITYIHPNLKKGASLDADTIVLEIEPTAFEFSLEQSKAGLASSEYSLEQLEVEEKSTLLFLKILKKNVELGKVDLKGSAKLLNQKIISPTKHNAAEQKQLQLQQQLEELQGKLASFPSRKAVINAQISKSKAQLEQSQDVLDKTKIRLPFGARIGDVYIEKDGYIGVGGQLFEALGTQAVEVNAQLPIKQFSNLLAAQQSDKGAPLALNLQSAEQLQAQISNLKLAVNVELVQDGGLKTLWHGELVRVGEAVNPTTNTIGLVVKIANPYQDVLPGKQPPLLKGMFVRTEFFTPPKPQIILPRKAIHEGRVYIANDEGKLSIKKVEISQVQGELAVLKSGVKVGEQVIITDLVPVIEGQPLNVIVDKSEQNMLELNALGHQKLDIDKTGDAK